MRKTKSIKKKRKTVEQGNMSKSVAIPKNFLSRIFKNLFMKQLNKIVNLMTFYSIL